MRIILGPQELLYGDIHRPPTSHYMGISIGFQGSKAIKDKTTRATRDTRL
jgi:hypothetical protein